MAQTATNVSAAKPKVGGAVWVGTAGLTELITAKVVTIDSSTNKGAVSTSAALPDTFVSLGYISEDGLTNENTRDSEEIKAWGGDVVYTPQTGYSETYAYTLIESLNKDVLKEVYGEDNVTVDESGNISITKTSDELSEKCYVIDMIMRNKRAKRIVIPIAKVTEIGEITYSDSEAAGYETTITATPDTYGNYGYEGIAAEA